MTNRSARRAGLLRIFAISAVLTLTIGLAVSCAFVAPEDIPALTSDAATLVAGADGAAQIAESAAPVEPTVAPTPEPTAVPTQEPTPTLAPTLAPTLEPTPEPTLEPTLEPTPEPTVEPTAVAIAVVQPVLMNARKGPGTDFPVVDKVAGGAEGTVLASGENDWYLVQFEAFDEPVWVSGNFVELTGNAAGILPLGQTDPVTLSVTTTQPLTDSLALAIPTESAVPTVAPTATPSVPVAVVSAAVMNVRQGPGTTYGVATTAKAGTVAKILGSSPDGQWYQVELDGQDEPVWLFAGLTSLAGPLDQIVPVPEDQLPPAPTPAPAPVAAPAQVYSASAAGVPPPAGGGSFGYGFQIQPYSGADLGFAINATRDAGFNWIKFQVPWRDFEGGGKGQIGWDGLDNIINPIAGSGIQILASIVKAPEWSRPSGTNLSVEGPPANNQDYADFVRAFASRYAGRVQAIEVWNEQNLWYEWGGEPLDAGRYVDMLCKAYSAIKSADPNMMVISGAPTPTGVNDGNIAIDDFIYLQQMYDRGAKNCLDGVGAHPSGYNNPPNVRYPWDDPSAPSFKNHPSFFFQDTMMRYRDVMVKYGDTNKRIWPTEFGWASTPFPNPGYEYAQDVSSDEQANYLVTAYQLMRGWGWVGPAFAWNLNFGITNPGTELAQFAIWGRPAYDALRGMPK